MAVQCYKGDAREVYIIVLMQQMWFMVTVWLHTFLTLALHMKGKSNLTLEKEPLVPLNMRMESTNSFWLYLSHHTD
jgi:hypothetical protein